MGGKGKKRSGASMMEVMIALVVAATLSAVAAPNWQKATEKKKADRALAALMTISECIKQYKVEYRLSSLPGMTFGQLQNYGCLSLTDFPQNYGFPVATDPVPSQGPVWYASGDRAVCVTDVGNLDGTANVLFFDGPKATLSSKDTCVQSYSGFYRRISESEIGRQRGS